MCGIFGFSITSNQESVASTAAKMGSILNHRGPDEFGQWKGTGLLLGACRLAITDIARGQQPAHNENQDITAVLNGEIFNCKELRQDLEQKGHLFQSQNSDTEVLPHLYEEYGRNFLLRLNGMFAIALWDERRKELFLARDACGIKPLFYAEVPSGIVFGSEIKAL